MLKWLYSCPETLERLRSGPLGPYLDDFARVLKARGYSRGTGRTHLQLLRQLSEWLERRGLGVEDVDESRLAEFLHEAARGREYIHRSQAAALWLLLAHLRENGTLPVPPVEEEETPLRRLEGELVRYLVEERGLASSTVERSLLLIRSFLVTHFGTGPLSLDALSPSDVTRFVLRYTRSGAPRNRPRSAKNLVSALRAFFRFLRLRGDITVDLAAAVPRVARWRHAGLPKALPPEQVRQLLESCDRSRPVGRRDYAVLLLMARLGLRAGEVLTMRLGDLDWEAGEILVRGKGHRLDRLPLPGDVGEALAIYLESGRPRCTARQVFVRARAPYRGLAGSSSIDAIVRQALERAGLDPPFKGAHLLRHSLATEMLRQGASLGEIGLILRHRQPATTEIYAKVDLEALRAVALPWPGAGP